jgi:adenylate cyclase
MQRVRRAIVVVDVVESVRLMQLDEAGVIDRWRRFVNEVRTKVLPAHGGRLVKSLGDGMLLEFEEVAQAVAAAGDMQRRCDAAAFGLAPASHMRLRIGIHVADVHIDELDIYGPGVNLAARLSTLAGPGQIVASADTFAAMVPGLDGDAEDLGECWLKHLAEPVRAYRLAGPLPQGGDATLQPPPTERLRPAIAILNFAGARGHSVLGSLLADELASLLTVNAAVDVLSRLSTRQAQGANPERAAQLLARLRANYAVSGSCVEADSRFRLTLELVYAANNQVLWSASTGGVIDDVVRSPKDVLEQMCTDVLAAVAAHETRRARTLPIASIESYTLLVGGVSLLHRLSQRDFLRSRELLDAVTERVPRHPDAYAWLAKWHILRAHQGWSDDPVRSASQAHDSARRALDLDDECTLALTIAGMVKVYFERQLDAGQLLYEQALRANPSDALAWLLKGTLHGFRGEGEEALHDTRRALALSPLDPMHYYYDALAASAAASAGLYEEAIQLAQRSLRANSMHASTLRVLAISCSMLGRMDEARSLVERMQALEPEFTVSRFLARAPGADFPIGKTFAQALARAGVPD